MSSVESVPVTVIALCFNHERFVIECLESIRLQTFQNFQLIVTDDLSSDSSPELIAAWLGLYYPDALYLRHQKNVGICRTLNEALSYARGEYISMIATDDIWELSKIEGQLSIIQSCPKEIAVAYSDSIQIDEEGNRLTQNFIEYYLPGQMPPTGEIFRFLAAGNFIPAMTTLVRRQAIVAAGGYDERLIYEDYDMWLRLAACHQFIFIPGIVARYRIVSNSMVRSKLLKINPDYLYSECVIYEKWLGANVILPNQRRQWAERHWGSAYYLYCCDDLRAVKRLIISAFYLRKLKPLLLATSLFLGLTRTRLKTVSLFFK